MMDETKVVEWLALAVAAVGFLAGLLEYRTAQKWKRTEFVATEAAALFGDSQIRIALLLIDYNNITLKPDGTRATPQELMDPMVQKYVYGEQELIDSLAFHDKFVNEIEKFTPQQMLAREAFDSLFTALERFGHYVKTDLVDIEDVRVHLQYWIHKMADPNSGWKENPQFYVTLHRFVREYGYNDVLYLFKELLPDSRVS